MDYKGNFFAKSFGSQYVSMFVRGISRKIRLGAVQNYRHCSNHESNSEIFDFYFVTKCQQPFFQIILVCADAETFKLFNNRKNLKLKQIKKFFFVTILRNIFFSNRKFLFTFWVIIIIIYNNYFIPKINNNTSYKTFCASLFVYLFKTKFCFSRVGARNRGN